MNEVQSHLEQIARRTTTLYSLPAVAVEIVRLTDQPHVDTHALKNCLEKDPALTSKVLRVVNSSLFGLRCPVLDLNQAISLLGTKPLKLLVLGFSLPDGLFRDVALEQLQWYWANTLTRAVAARLISERLWHQPGDEAFIAGLLQDVGILALVHDVGEPYTKFLSGVIREQCHLAALEQETLGFNHVALTAELLTQWHLPQWWIDAIAMPKQTVRLAELTSPQADLPRM